MGRKYANPPVVEAVCEFRLTPDTPWDITIPGLVYEKLREVFLHREQRMIQEVEIITGLEGLQQRIRTSERILLFADDRKTFVQLGPRLLAVNSLRPYPTWAGFKPKVERAFEALSHTVDIRGLERIGLRYINRIEIPGGVSLKDYFQFYLFLGPQLPQDIADFMASSDFVYADGRDRCRVQLRPAPPSTLEGAAALMLDIDYFLAEEKGVDVRAAIDWVEEAHEKVEEVFEGCITDSLRNLFQEVRA